MSAFAIREAASEAVPNLSPTAALPNDDQPDLVKSARMQATALSSTKEVDLSPAITATADSSSVSSPTVPHPQSNATQSGKKRKASAPPVESDAVKDADVKESKPSNKRLRKPLRRPIMRPMLPELLRHSNPDPVRQAQQQAEMDRALDPCIPVELASRVDTAHRSFGTAYMELNNELIRAQIEESVLRNIRTVVVNLRDQIRHS